MKKKYICPGSEQQPAKERLVSASELEELENDPACFFCGRNKGSQEGDCAATII